jgi:hypothetical protein
MVQQGPNSNQPSVYCVDCGTENIAGSNFCEECGSELDDLGRAESPTDKSGDVNKIPGISSNNTTRRNVMIASLYGLGGVTFLGIIGSTAEDENTTSGGSTDGEPGAGSSESEEEYSNAFYHDNSKGLVLEDDIEAESEGFGTLYISGTLRNVGDSDYDYVQISFSVFDDSGAKIADALANTSGLPSGQSWKYEALAPGSDGAESYKLQDITAY